MTDTVEIVAKPTGASRKSLVGIVVAGRYRVESEIGLGGMGTVYKAMHEDIGKPVALKVLHPHFVEGGDRGTEMFARFRQEAKAASRIGHENITSVSDFGTMPDGSPFFVMEYLEGEDLKATLKREKRLPWRRVFQWGIQICSALQAAHDDGIIHRDVKPENFFRTEAPLDATGRDMAAIGTDAGMHEVIKVLDFGVAKLVDEESIVTRTGMYLGTPEYMSPEQAEGAEPDHRLDVYGVGILLFQLISGQVPFSGGDEFEILEMHCKQKPPRPSDVNSAVRMTAKSEAVLFKALEKKPDHRFQSMDDFAKAMKKALAEAASRGDDPAVEDDDLRDGSGSKTGLIVGIAAAVAALGGLAYVLLAL